MNLQAFVPAVLLISACMAHAELARDAAPDPLAGRSATAAPFAGADKGASAGATDSGGGDVASDAATAASVMKEHLARDEPAGAGLPPGGVNPQASRASRGQVTSQRPEPVDSGLAGTIKDFVKPIQEGVAQSGVMEAVRNLESEMGLGKRNDGPDGTAPGYSSGAPGSGGPVRTPEQIRRDQLAASIMFDEFINEVKPWAFGLAGLLVLGYLVKLWFTYVRMKAARPGQRRRSMRRRHRHRQRE